MSRFLGCGLLLALAAACSAHGQGMLTPRVTGYDGPAGGLKIGGVESAPGASAAGSISLVDGALAMIYSESGRAAVVAAGPAEFSVRTTDLGIDFELNSGTLIFSTTTPSADQGIELVVRDGADTLARGPLAAGDTYVTRTARLLSVAYVAAAPDTGVDFGGRVGAVAAGEMVTVDGGGRRVGRAAPPESVDDLVTRLSLATAIGTREIRQQDLFDRVVVWDRLGSAAAVTRSPKIEMIRTEYRQIARAAVAAPTGGGAQRQVTQPVRPQGSAQKLKTGAITGRAPGAPIVRPGGGPISGRNR